MVAGINDYEDYLDYFECLQRGYSHSNKIVCHDCISDYALEDYIKQNGTRQTCSYCGKNKTSVRLEELMAPVMSGIKFRYSPSLEDPSADIGQSCGTVYRTEDIFYNDLRQRIGAAYDSITDDMISLIGDETWCDANLFDNLIEEVEYDHWQRFCRLVKEKMRYVFFDAKLDENSNQTPMDILNFIASSIERIGLTTTINKNTKMFRCRMSRGEKYFSSISDFCPPPIESASAGRMNAQGIGVLYLTLDQQTAIIETDSNEKTLASVASYRVEDSLPVLDLTKLTTIRIPSIFDEEGRNKISAIRFLKKFNETISQKVAIEQIDYVPTQIVTEYFRFLNHKGNSKYQGIMYDSAKNPGGKCLVLFMSREDVLNGKSGIHIIPKQTQYYTKEYKWVENQFQAITLFANQIINDNKMITATDVSEEFGLSKANAYAFLKQLCNQGVMSQSTSSLGTKFYGRNREDEICTSK